MPLVSPSFRARRLAAAAGALGLLLVAPGAAHAATVPAQSPGDAAAGFLLRAFNSSEGRDRLAGFDAASTVGVTADGVVSLVAAGYGREVVPRALSFLAANTGTTYAATAAGDLPGRLGKLALAFSAAEQDARAVGGTDLVARIEARLVPAGDATRPPGRYDEADGNNSALKQSLALLGLRAAGATPDASAVSYLLSQQCDAPATAAGGFPGGSATPVGGTTTCTAADPNATAYAVMALAAIGGQAAAVESGLAFLDRIQNVDGGLGFAAGATTDANSTGLGVQAVLAGGENPAAGRWANPGGSLRTALLNLQAGAEYTQDDAKRGGFFYDEATRASADDAANDPDTFSSSQASAAAANQALPVRPLAPSRLSADEPVVAAAAPTAAPSPVSTTSPTTPAPTTEPGTAPAPGSGVGAVGDLDSEPGTLPATGVSSGDLLGLGLAAVVAGAGLAVAGRRLRGAHRA